MLPTFVIIGAQKSSSSFMQRCLADHPEIYLPEGETSFFESPDYEQSKIAELEQIFIGRNEKCLGIKRPNYIGKPEVPARIQAHLPEAKLIAVLRSPVDRAISAYFHYMKDGFIPLLDPELGIRRIINDPSFGSQYKRAAEIIEFGYYYKYLSQYSPYLSSDRLLVFLFEDIVARPLASVRRAYEFLGVAPDFIPNSLNSRPQRVVYNLTRIRLLSYRNRFMYSYNRERTRVFPKEMTTAEKILVKLITGVDRLLLAKFLSNNKPQIGLPTRQMLYDLYASDLAFLADFIDRDLSAWKPRR